MLSGFSRFISGLSIKLLLEFNFLVVLAFIATALFLALSSLVILNQTQQTVSRTGVPIISSAYELAHESEAVLASAPGLAAARVESQRKTILFRIHDQFERMERLVGSLKVIGQDHLAALLEQVETDMIQLRYRLEALEAMVARRIEARRDFDGLKKDLKRTLASILPMASGHRSKAINWARRSIELHLRKAELVVFGNPLPRLAHGAKDMRSLYLMHLTQARQETVDLAPDDQAILLATIDSLEAFGKQERDIFSSAWEVQDAIRRTEGLRLAYDQTARRQVFAVGSLVRAARTEIESAFETSIEQMENRSWILAGVSGITFLVALVFSLLVLFNVSRRLDTLKAAMDRAAKGGPLDIDISGSDEISHMAEALHGFVVARNKAEERERLAREAAEQSSAAKSRFLAAASHDLRQPLQAITLFLSVLSEGATPAQQPKLIEKTRLSVDSLRGILDRVLDMSKLEAGLISPQMRATPIAPLMRRLAEEFTALSASKNLDFRFIPSSVTVQTDEALLDTLLRNLLSNAVKFTEEGRILLGARRRPDSLEIQVWDTGIGIPEDKTDSVFEEFYQIGNEERDRNKGLGLGLSIVKRMALLLNHPIQFRSHPDRGTMFSIVLLTGGEEPLTPPLSPPDKAEHLNGKRVLLIEDDMAVAEATATFLEHWGCEVFISSCINNNDCNYPYILDERARKPDFIIADYRLPFEQTGAWAVSRIRAHFDTQIPAMLITGDTNPSRLQEAALSSLPLLHKPINPDQLHRTIADLLR
ncbi:Putative histidine kinase with signal transduction response regulator domain [Magnetospira sp. QH-2]|nr:Putative histidine kinase with signal transduction response regulator domain [Magnetospira sp. QH-2]